MIDLRVLGALEVGAGRPNGTRHLVTQPKRLALLVYLALAEPSGFHARDRLLALLWPEADDRSSRHSLRNALHALRQALGDDAIVTRGDAFVGLNFELVRCDALELRAHVAAGRLDDALTLWKGEVLPGFHVSDVPEFERWLEQQREDLLHAVRAAAWKRSAALAGAGRAELDATRFAYRLDPGDEPGARRFMRLLAAAGDRAGALQVYQDLTAFFARELEAEPSAETRRLAADVRSRAPDEPVRAPVPATVPASEPMGASEPAADDAPVASRSERRTRRVLALGSIGLAALAVFLYLARNSLPASTAQSQAARAVLRLPARDRADTSAYSSYLRGLTLRFQFRFMASRDTFESLVDRKPLYVPGLYGLSQAYIFTALNDLTDPDETWPKIDVTARRALALDTTAASAWLALAAEDMYWHLDLPRAQASIARARAIDAVDPDVAGIQSVWFQFSGEMDSAIAEARLAHQIDPLSPLFARLVAQTLFFARHYEESRKIFTQMVRDDATWTRGYTDLAQLYSAMGRPRDAVGWLRRARAAAGDSAGAAALPDASSDTEASRLLAADARRTIARLDRAARNGERAPASRYAVTYATLGDTASTLNWLDSIVARHDSYLHAVRVDPVFDFVRRLPRYQAWDRASGLPPLARSAHR
ncbi:MAG TPA: BTAD domain-containing putative transcriptional regulator [Gemmatimonadaceae bacterium]